MNVPIVERQKDIIRKILGKLDQKNNFLEIGCGEGHMTELLVEAGAKGQSIDISKYAISRARKRNLPGVEFNLKDVMDMKKGGHDLAVLLFVLEHIKDDQKALDKISSLLKKDGHFILSVPAHRRSYSNQDRLCGHFRRYDRKQIYNMLKKSDFRIIKNYTIGFPVASFYTWCYNLLLKMKGKGKKISVENTKISGTSSKKHFPGIVRLISGVLFPILTFLVKLDALFQNSNLGTHYIILCKKR